MLDREALEQAGTFGQAILALRPDAVIDMICFTLASAQQLAETLLGHVEHFLHCGTIWRIKGPPSSSPRRARRRRPSRRSASTESADGRDREWLLLEAKRGAVSFRPRRSRSRGTSSGPATHGHQSGGQPQPGRLHPRLARGRRLPMPRFWHGVCCTTSTPTMSRRCSCGRWRTGRRGGGGSFFAVAPAAVTTPRAYAEEAARWFGPDRRSGLHVVGRVDTDPAICRRRTSEMSHGCTSRTAPVLRHRERPSAGSATPRAIRHCKRSTNRSCGWSSKARSRCKSIRNRQDARRAKRKTKSISPQRTQRTQRKNKS